LIKSSLAMKKDIHEIDRSAMSLLSQYSWPGNIRELENVIESAVALETGSVIRPDSLPEYMRTLSIETYRQRSSDAPTLKEHEKRYIAWVLEKSQGNKTQAAKILDIDRVSLWRKMKRYMLE
jgi:transcriptional regulator with PAS, ATPase and Fis domain